MVCYQITKDCTIDYLLICITKKKINKIRTHNYLKQCVCDTYSRSHFILVFVIEVISIE